jgi:putative FmdB family regulatory protein
MAGNYRVPRVFVYPRTPIGRLTLPTYEYECTACGHAFEKFQPITSKPIRKCPACGKTKVKRLIGTGAGLIFKGSGFYITDYRGESYDKAAKADAPDAAAKSTDAKADAKPAGDAKPADAKPAAANADKQAPAKSEPKAESKPAPKAPEPKASKSARKTKH